MRKQRTTSQEPAVTMPEFFNTADAEQRALANKIDALVAARGFIPATNVEALEVIDVELVTTRELLATRAAEFEQLRRRDVPAARLPYSTLKHFR